jgi:hypothetical protein
VLSAPDEVFSRDLPRKWETQTVGEWLLMLAALLWPLDVAVRRLQLPERWWSSFVRTRQVQQSATASDQQSVLAKLQQKRGTVPRSAVSQERVQPVRPSEVAATRTESGASRQQQETRTEKPEQRKTAQPQGKTEQSQSDDTLNRLLAAKKRKNQQ